MRIGDLELIRKLIVIMLYIVPLLIGTNRYLRRWVRLLRKVFRALRFLWHIKVHHSIKLMKDCYKYFQDVKNWEQLLWSMLKMVN
jgi:hypothetical protein